MFLVRRRLGSPLAAGRSALWWTVALCFRGWIVTEPGPKRSRDVRVTIEYCTM